MSSKPSVKDAQAGQRLQTLKTQIIARLDELAIPYRLRGPGPPGRGAALVWEEVALHCDDPALRMLTDEKHRICETLMLGVMPKMRHYERLYGSEYSGDLILHLWERLGEYDGTKSFLLWAMDQRGNASEKRKKWEHKHIMSGSLDFHAAPETDNYDSSKIDKELLAVENEAEEANAAGAGLRKQIKRAEKPGATKARAFRDRVFTAIEHADRKNAFLKSTVLPAKPKAKSEIEDD